MPNTARTQMALAESEHFRSRLAAALAKVAWQVLTEAPATPNHAVRAAYARGVIDAPGTFATRLAPQMTMRTNVFAFATSYDFDLGAVVTTSGDADIESQLATDWNTLAGV